MTLSPLRLVALTHYLNDVLDFPDRASVRPKDALEWFSMFQAKARERESALVAGLALADHLEARYDPAAPGSQEEAVRTILEATSAAQEAEQARRQAADAQAAALREERRQAFVRRHGLSPETAKKMRWDPSALAGLLDDSAPGPQVWQ